MKKGVLVRLIAIMMILCFSASAEYKDYELTVGDASSALTWSFYPIDAHNVVVIARSLYGQDWHVSWYRDSELFRDISGKSENKLVESIDIPLPLIGKDGSFAMLHSVRDGELKYTETNGQRVLDASNYKFYLAQWTEHGFDQEKPLKESWYGPFFGGTVICYDANPGITILYNGKETHFPAISEDLRKHINNCVPLADEVFLIRINQPGKERLICIDHGREKYQIEIPAEAYSILPDGHGGFFCPDNRPTEDSSPVLLMHCNKDGKMDRTVSLIGSKVVITVTDSHIDSLSGLCTVYGSVASASRKKYSVFALKIDGEMNICDLDIRNIDPVYRDYCPMVKTAPDGAVYVFICEYEGRKGLKPVLIPFSMLEKSKDDYGMTLQQTENEE